MCALRTLLSILAVALASGMLSEDSLADSGVCLLQTHAVVTPVTRHAEVLGAEQHAQRPLAKKEPLPAAAMAQFREQLAGSLASAVAARPWAKRVFVFVLVSLAVLFASVLIVLLCLGRIIKAGIEHFDRKFIGVDIDISKLSVSIFSGRVEVNGVNVHNPEGFKSPHVLSMKNAVIDINMHSLISSFGKNIEVQEIKLVEVDCIVEYSGYIPGVGESNVTKLMDNLHGDGVDKKPSEKRQKKQDATAVAGEKSERNINVKNVKMVDIGAKLESKIFGARVAVADIVHEDFSEEVGAHVIDDIVWCMLRSLVKSILANLGNKSFADKLM